MPIETVVAKLTIDITNGFARIFPVEAFAELVDAMTSTVAREPRTMYVWEAKDGEIIIRSNGYHLLADDFLQSDEPPIGAPFTSPDNETVFLRAPEALLAPARSKGFLDEPIVFKIDRVKHDEMVGTFMMMSEVEA